MYYCVNCCDDKVTGKTGEEIIKYAQKQPEMSSLPLTEFALGKHINDIATLTNSHYIEFPGTGHGVINNGSCALSVIKSFFDTPTSRPDDPCVRELTGPKFAMPEAD